MFGNGDTTWVHKFANSKDSLKLSEGLDRD